MTTEELIKRIKQINPAFKPIEECTDEEKEAYYDSIFDWEEDE